jgi:16S rRNA (cytidine1402-2'-O)-methyltransferase
MSAPSRAPGRLYLVPNLLGLVPPEAVLPQKTIDVARTLRHFVVETPKLARQFLKAIGSHHGLQSLELSELNEHTPPEHADALLGPAIRGEDLGLLSDAGCPGVADPGAALVAAAHGRGIRVVPLVGPSAILLALMASGMNGQAFAFHGYLPVPTTERAAALKSLDRAAAQTGATQVFIETPYRNEAMVEAVLATCSARVRFCVAVELTLASELVISRPIAVWRASARPSLSRRPALFLLGR